jgi:hypothetical protein
LATIADVHPHGHVVEAAPNAGEFALGNVVSRSDVAIDNVQAGIDVCELVGVELQLLLEQGELIALPGERIFLLVPHVINRSEHEDAGQSNRKKQDDNFAKISH